MVPGCLAVCTQTVQDHSQRLQANPQPTRLSKALFSFRLESPTRALVMEAPKGIEINAEAGSLKATCRTELRLESKDGEVSRASSFLANTNQATDLCRLITFPFTQHLKNKCQGIEP